MTGAVADSRRSQAADHLPGEGSMWFFVIGDLLIFGGYFVGYMYFRGQEHAVFLAGQARLNVVVGAVNTIMLLTSSLFVALGTAVARSGRTRDAARLFGVGWAFGAAFPLLKLFEYVPEITAGLTPGTSAFFMFYFVMTGLHLCHVLLGLVVIGFVIRNLLAQPKLSFVETGATYWHMVDVLWLILFALLYLMR